MAKYLKQTRLYQHGWVRLRAVHGDESFIAESARQSTSGESKGEELDGKLVGSLWTREHTSPSEMASATWDVKLPLYIANQFLRHRTAKYWKVNSFSFRYSNGVTEGRQVDPENPGLQWYIPETLPIPEGSVMDGQCRKAVSLYHQLILNGVKSEDARAVLPGNIFVRIRFQIDMNNAMQFFRLRCAKNAQAEARAYASVMREQVREFFPSLFDAEHRRAHDAYQRGYKAGLAAVLRNIEAQTAELVGLKTEAQTLLAKATPGPDGGPGRSIPIVSGEPLSWQDKQALQERIRTAKLGVVVEERFAQRVRQLLDSVPLDPEALDPDFPS